MKLTFNSALLDMSIDVPRVETCSFAGHTFPQLATSTVITEHSVWFLQIITQCHLIADILDGEEVRHKDRDEGLPNYL